MPRNAVTILLVVVVLALLAGAFYIIWTDAKFLNNEDEPIEWPLYKSSALGLSFNYPPEYTVEEAPGDISIRPQYPSQAQLSGLMPIYIKVEPLGTSTFATYEENLKANLITSLAWQKHQEEVDEINNEVSLGTITSIEGRGRLVALEQQIAEEVLSYNGHYSFIDKKVDGFTAIAHERDFYNRVSPVKELYLNGGSQVIVFSTETSSDVADKVFSSIKKI